MPPHLKSILWKSAALALIAGLYGIADLDRPFFAMYAEVPPPLLGNPFVYQTLSNCINVCPPLVYNNFLIAAIDYFTFFALCFVIVFPILYKFSPNSSVGKGIFKRDSIAVTFLVAILILVSFATYGSSSQGASLTEPHWPTPSGVEVYPSEYTLYSGNATTNSTRGTAHLDLVLANYYWTPLNVSFTISLRSGRPYNSTTAVQVYQCPTPSSCKQISSVTVPPYSSLNLTTPINTLYLGTFVSKGESYNIQVNMMTDGIISQNAEVAR